MNPEINAEILRILDLLRTLIRILGLSNREIERRAGFSPSYLSRLFGNYLELKYEHVLEISRALGITPREFFELAYPDSAETPTESMKRIRNTLQTMQPAPRPVDTSPKPASGLSAEEVERRIQEALRVVFQDLGRTGSGG
ncbi:MAG TPA: helix-turn-helix transcriptional regulator [Thermoanaerobaculia bacterium]|jgi:transcriptional regulator with XRE-family HTH domain|nr:helix-turn-helix transcriptional regulator [Thermoanaerobaculia bacterium]